MSRRRTGRGSPVGLRRRWLRNTIMLVIPVMTVCIFALTAAFAAHYYASLESDLSYRASATVDLFSEYTDITRDEFYQSCVSYAQRFSDPDGIALQFVTPGGILASSSGDYHPGSMVQTPDITQAIQTRTQAEFLGDDPIIGQRVKAVSAPVIFSDGEVIGVFRFVCGTAETDLRILMIALLAACFCGIFVLLVVLVSNYYINSILVPLSDITAKAKMIADGSYGVQIQTKYDDEIGELADTINEMSVQISQNEKSQTEFISSLSHELRTPLTAITGWGETLLSAEKMDAQQTRRGMQIILREARRLTEMVVDLLDFTRIQDGRMTLNVEPTDIRSEFEDTVFMYGSRLKQDGITIQYHDSDEDIPEIPCDPKRMRQVFLNIFDNAAKHGGEGKIIDASIGLRDHHVVIRIRDHGPGIPEDELPLVKKKFYKGSSKARGSGIGLAVCDEILQMHGGWLELSNAAGGGTLVNIGLPLAQ